LTPRRFQTTLDEQWGKVLDCSANSSLLFNNNGQKEVLVDGLVLPYVTRDVTLEQTIEHMQRLDRRAVVVDYGNWEMMLYMNKDVLRAWARGLENASALKEYSGDRVTPLFYDGLSTERTIWFGEAVERALQREDAEYGALFSPSPSPGLVIIVTEHEGGRNRIETAQKYCVCSMDTKDDHPEESPPFSDNDPCKYGDGGQYKCA
jgi:hypothetical protein